MKPSLNSLLEIQEAIRKKKFSLAELNELLPVPIEITSTPTPGIHLKLDGCEPGNPQAREKRQQELDLIRQTRQEAYESLSKREIEVIRQVVKGLKNGEIAEVLFISRATVEQHRKNIRKKLDFPTDLELYNFARAFDLF